MSRRQIDRYLYDEGYALIRSSGHRIYRNALGQTIVVSNTPRNRGQLFLYVQGDVRRNRKRALRLGAWKVRAIDIELE